MVSLAVLGFIIATVAYFSSTHTFADLFKTIEYKIETYSLVDSDKAANMWPGQELDSDLIVKNTGQCPVLVRVKYVYTSHFNKDENLKALELPLEIGVSPIETQTYSSGSTVDRDYKFMTTAVNTDKFLYDETDNCYYYKGILNPTEEVQHLDSVKNTMEKNISNNERWKSELNLDENFNYTQDKDKIKYYAKYMFSSEEIPAGFPVPLKACVETIQATDANGNYLNSETVQNADVSTLKGYWAALGK